LFHFSFFPFVYLSFSYFYPRVKWQVSLSCGWPPGVTVTVTHNSKKARGQSSYRHLSCLEW
jgi:hypothetical protein